MRDPEPAELLSRNGALRRHALDGLLVGNVPLRRVGREAATPCWVVSADVVRARVRAVRDALLDLPVAVDLHYAVKANDNIAVLAVLRREQVGADVVSAGELAKASRAGMDARNVIFSGVGKSRAELVAAVTAGVGQINVESREELVELSAVAAGLGREVAVAIRVNPDVEASTLDKISTGRVGDKFGVAWGDAVGLYGMAAGLPGVRPVGLAVHIGSQVRRGEAFAAAFAKVAGLVRDLRARGLSVGRVDCGGGLAIPYRGDEGARPELMAAAIGRTMGGLGVRVAVELGRWIVGPAGLLLTRLIRVKRAAQARPFLVLDAAMNDLLRPALYGAWHGIVPVDPAVTDRPPETVDVVGPVCESSDVFAKHRMLPVGEPGSLYAILDAGAYGSVMSSTYNGRPMAAQVMVDGDRWAVIRERDPVERLWERERMPDWFRE